MKKYDYLIVGAGLYGAVMAYELGKKGKKCLVIDRRDHIAGNIYCEDVEGIHVHKYGAHIFHTSDKKIWDYVNQFADFNNYINSPVAVYKDELYNLPFNMNTFSKMWGIRTPQEAKDIIEKQRRETGITEPKNLEEQALFLVGRDIYEKLVKGYTEKQWGRKCTELPAFISRDCRAGSFMTTIILMTDIRESRSGDIQRLWRRCLPMQMCGQVWISLNSGKRIRTLRRRLSSQV